MKIEVGARTDLGMVRGNNEDCFAVDLPLQLMVLCDGMGGQAAGEVASKMAVDTILEHCRQGTENPQLPIEGPYHQEFSPQSNRLASAIRLSNKAIRQTAKHRAGTNGMGSTVVAVQLAENLLSIAHVGDSRIYLYRDGSLRPLTQDHSLVNEQIKQGIITREEAKQSILANVILRALGAQNDVTVDLCELEAKERDLFLLCSDGLTHMVPDAQIAQVMAEKLNPRQMADRLVEVANQAGGKDNVTVIVLRVKEPFGRMLKRIISERLRGEPKDRLG